MIELTDIIMFIAFTGILMTAEGVVYNSIRSAFKIMPVSMAFSAILVLFWNILP